MENRPIIAILLGDAAGVGPEIIAKLAVKGFFDEYCKPIVIGDFRVLARAFEVIGARTDVQIIENADEADWSLGLPFIDRKNCDPLEVPFAKANPIAGHANVDAMDYAVKLYKENKIAGICFGPFNKAMLKEDSRMLKADGSHYESEHHYIAHLLKHTEAFGEINAVKQVWTTRTTSHIPIAEVSRNLTLETIGRAITLMYKTLRNAGVKRPRIAVAALNPHAGEEGTCGREEIDVISPAIAIANDRYETDRITGPYPSDTLFVKAFQGEFDGVVTMYHDQGQIALKLMGFDEGITIAGGFEVPIVTGGHGTAYDIAGKNVVKTSAFENAIKMCTKMANAKIAK